MGMIVNPYAYAAAGPGADALRDEILADLASVTGGLWLLNETSGTTFANSGATAFGGLFTATNVTLNQAPLTNGSPSILCGSNGSETTAQVGNHAAIDVGALDFTFGLAFKRAATSSARSLFCKEKIGTDYPEYALSMNSAGKLLLGLSTTNGPAGYAAVTSANEFDDGARHLAIVVRDATANMAHVFVDNVLEASMSFSGTVWNSGNHVCFGSSQFNTGGFNSQAFGGYISHAFLLKGLALDSTRLAVYQTAFSA